MPGEGRRPAMPLRARPPSIQERDSSRLGGNRVVTNRKGKSGAVQNVAGGGRCASKQREWQIVGHAAAPYIPRAWRPAALHGRCGLRSPATICATNDGDRHARGAVLAAFPTSTPTPPKTTAPQCWPPRHTIPTAAAPRRSWLDHRRTSDLVALRSHLPREYGDDDEETMTETGCAVPTTVDRHVTASGVAVRADRRSARMTYAGGRRTDVVRVTRLRASRYRREGAIRPDALIGVPVPPRRGAACSGPGQPVPRPWPLRHRT